MSDTLTKYNLKAIDYIDMTKTDDAVKKDIKKSEKLSRLAIRTLLIAKEKEKNVNRILTFDL